MALTPFLLGKDLSALTIAPITVSSAGAVSVGSATDVKPFVVSIEGTRSEELEDIRPVWSVQRNMVRTGVGNNLRISLLQRADAANYAITLSNSSYCQVAWAQGNLVSQVYTGQFKISSISYGVNSRGQNTNNIDLEPINNSEADNVIVT